MAQYTFGPGNALACESIARVYLLLGVRGGFRKAASVTLPTHRHSFIQSIEFLSQGNGAPLFLIESDVGGPGVVSTSLSIFAFEYDAIIELLNVPGRVADSDPREVYVQTIDPGESAKQESKFCFTKKIFADEKRWYQPPQVVSVCYARGTGAAQR